MDRFGETITDEGHKNWYCVEDSKHQCEVAFIVRKEVVSSIISCTPFSSRLFSTRISARPHNITVVQDTAPASDHEDEEVEQFYGQLDSIKMQRLPRRIYL